MPAGIRRYIALTTKEVQQLRRNRVLLIQLMLPPTIVLIIFGFALNPKVRDLRLGIVDESLTTESRGFVDSLTQNVDFEVVGQYRRAKDAEDALRSLDLDAFIVIPAEFARTLGRGQTASVQVVIDAVDANTAQITQGYLGMALEEYNLSGGGGGGVPPEKLRAGPMLVRSAHPTPPPGIPQVRPAYIYNPGLVTTWHYVTGVMSIIMFINASLVASALAVKEKETGTIEQLLMTPAQTGEMRLAKTYPESVHILVVLFEVYAGVILAFGRPVRRRLGYMVTIVRGVTLKDAPWSALWPNLVALAVFSVLLFSISAWRFRKV